MHVSVPVYKCAAVLPGQDMDQEGEGAGHQVYVEEGEDEGGGSLHVLPVHLLAHLLQGGPHLQPGGVSEQYRVLTPNVQL